MKIMNFKRDLITIIVLNASFNYVNYTTWKKGKKG